MFVVDLEFCLCSFAKKGLVRLFTLSHDYPMSRLDAISTMHTGLKEREEVLTNFMHSFHLPINHLTRGQRSCSSHFASAGLQIRR